VQVEMSLIVCVGLRTMVVLKIDSRKVIATPYVD
jgi:hypothetical protein